MNLKKRKKGFTLIELMAVIAIIAVLAAVLVPTVNGYITRSKMTAILTQVRNAVTAIETHNATVVGTNVISDSRSVSDALSTSKSNNGPKLEADFLKESDIDRLGSMTIYVAKKINDDPNAISKIELDSNTGVATKYNEKEVTVTTGL